MAVESAADRLSMLDDWDSGLYEGATTIQGIFDNDYQEVIDDSGVGAESSQPVFLCRTADVSSAAHGDTLVVNSTNYVVRGVQPDGTGMTLLMLEEQ